MKTDKLRQLVSLVEGLGGFNKVESSGGGDTCSTINFNYDDEESENYLDDDYEWIGGFSLDVCHDGVIYLDDKPIITGLTNFEIMEATKYISKSEESYLSEYNGKLYKHLVAVTEHTISNIRPNIPLSLSESFIETDDGKLIKVKDLT